MKQTKNIEIEVFILTTGKTMYVKQRSGQNITRNVVCGFIDAICDKMKHPQELRERAKNCEHTINDFRRRITKCVLVRVCNDKLDYYKISSKYMCCSIPQNESECLVFID